MRKLNIAMVAALLALSMGVPATAAETEAESAEESTVYFEDMGMDVNLPEEYLKTDGFFVTQGFGGIDDGHHTYMTMFIYFAMPQDEVVNGLYDPELTDERYQEIMSTQALIGAVVSTDEDQNKALEAYDAWREGDYPVDVDNISEVGKADGYTFYFLPAVTDEKRVDSFEENYAKEYEGLVKDTPDMLKKDGKFYEPVDNAKKMAGTKIEFTTTDVDGNTVTSKELFAENKITMINCWGTWCPNCVGEMEELGKLHEKIKEKGGGIVGLEWERTPDEETYEKGKKLLEDSGVNYPNVLMPEDLEVDGFPTSIFVDQEGNVLGIPIVGAYVSGYEPAFESFLKGDKAEDATIASSDADSVNEAVTGTITGCNVYVKDENGPVAGVMVQMCSDVTCAFATTDAEGCAHFDMAADESSDVHILDAPEGYEIGEDVYHPSVEEGGLTIELKKA